MTKLAQLGGGARTDSPTDTGVTRNKLVQIISATASSYDVSVEVAYKLIAFIDLQKIMGAIGGMASSKFGDYLGFLRIPDDERMQNFFAERWADHMVRIDVPREYQKFLSPDAPMFTPSRMEPFYNKTPFYDAGITKTPTGMNRNPEDGGTVRKPKPMPEGYDNFLIEQYLPTAFYLEVVNEAIPSILNDGLPEVTFNEPYPLHVTANEARSGLNKHLYHKNGRIVTPSDLMRYTLIRIDPTKIELTTDTLFTRNDLEAGSSRQGGYFYTGKIPSSAVSIADENIT